LLREQDLITPEKFNAMDLLGNKPDACYVVGMSVMLLEDVRREAKGRSWRCALIVTALDLELQAVVAHIEPLASVRGRDGAIYECGAFHDVGQDWLIVVAESGAGTHPAQNTVTNAHIEFEPELQIFVGIGGSRKEDVPVGSVVAADHVYMPYGGKYGENGFSARPREFAADPQLLEVARKVRRDKNGSNGFATPRIASCRSSTNTQ
jgi:nucleoside phosphorylase